MVPKCMPYLKQSTLFNIISHISKKFLHGGGGGGGGGGYQCKNVV